MKQRITIYNFQADERAMILRPMEFRADEYVRSNDEVIVRVVDVGELEKVLREEARQGNKTMRKVCKVLIDYIGGQ